MIWEISTLLVAIAVVILVAFLVPALIQFKRSMRRVEEISNDLNGHLPNIMSNLDDITDNLSEIMGSARNQVETLETAVTEVKGLVDDVVGMERKLKKQLDSPLVRTVGTIAAAAKAAQVFMNAFGARNKRR